MIASISYILYLGGFSVENPPLALLYRTEHHFVVLTYFRTNMPAGVPRRTVFARLVFTTYRTERHFVVLTYFRTNMPAGAPRRTERHFVVLTYFKTKTPAGAPRRTAFARFANCKFIAIRFKGTALLKRFPSFAQPMGCSKFTPPVRFLRQKGSFAVCGRRPRLCLWNPQAFEKGLSETFVFRCRIYQ